jgi:hypothetical protein
VRFSFARWIGFGDFLHGSRGYRARKTSRRRKNSSGKYAANDSLRVARAVWNYGKGELESAGLAWRNPLRAGKQFHKAGASAAAGAANPYIWTASLLLQGPACSVESAPLFEFEVAHDDDRP